MPIIHQHNGFNFQIKPECFEPPYVCIIKENVVILIRIRIPEKELHHIISNENASREDLYLTFDIVSDYQEKFLNVWKRIHSQPV